LVGIVSNIGGTIKSGDFMTVSNLDGIAQKANSTWSRGLLDRRLRSFDGTSGGNYHRHKAHWLGVAD